MTKTRLEAFSDGVIAIIITIMVLELRAPDGSSWQSLRPLIPVMLAYVLSFTNIGIYWNNHHHMFHVCDRINGAILWANLHLLFWLSLLPFTTSWMDHAHTSITAATYGANLLCCGIAYTVLQATIIRFQGERSPLGAAVAGDVKGKVSLVLYLAAIPLAFVSPWIADALYVVVALMWLAPDPRIERHLARS